MVTQGMYRGGCINYIKVSLCDTNLYIDNIKTSQKNNSLCLNQNFCYICL